MYVFDLFFLVRQRVLGRDRLFCIAIFSGAVWGMVLNRVKVSLLGCIAGVARNLSILFDGKEILPPVLRIAPIVIQLVLQLGLIVVACHGEDLDLVCWITQIQRPTHHGIQPIINRRQNGRWLRRGWKCNDCM